MSHTPTGTSRSRREALLAQQEAEQRRQRHNRIVAAVIGVLLLVALAGLGTWLVQRHDKAKTTPTTAASAADNGARPPGAATDGLGIVYGNGKRPAASGVPVLVEYQDYQCSACKAYHQFYGPALKQLATEGKIVYELRTLTFIDQIKKNTSSVDAANAAACADSVGHYGDMYETIYDNSPQEGVPFTADQLRTQWPSKAGISGDDLTKYQGCYDQRTYAGFVTAVDRAGMSAGVTETPTFTVDGKQFDLSKSKADAASVLAAITAAK